MAETEQRRLATWRPRIAKTVHGWSVDWWEGSRHRQRRFKTEEDAKGFSDELRADRAAREDGERKQRQIVRANIRRGDVTVDLLNLSPAAKLAVAEALEVLRAEGGDPLDLPTAAREFAARHLSESRATLEEVLNRHLEDLRSLGRSKATIRQREDLGRSLCKSIGGTRRIGAVGRPEIAEWVATATPGSRRAYYTAAAALFRWAWQRGYCQEYPLGALPKPAQRRIPEPEILKPEHVRKLFETTVELYPAMVPYLALAVFAGLRPESELGHLQWEDIDLEERRIYCLSRKTGRARPVPISDNLHAWLLTVPKSKRTGKAAPFSRSAWRRIQAKAGVQVGHDVLRHTRVSYRLAVVKDPGIVAAEGGHTLSILQRHYANLRIKDAEAAEFWAIVPQEGKGGGQGRIS